MHFENAQKPPGSQRFRSRNSTLQHGQQVWQWFPTFRGNDHLGSSQIGFDLSGIVDFQEYYTPFGEVENASPLNDNMIGNSPHTTAVVFFAYFRFTGSKIMPSAYRLQIMQARLQDPVTGRFLSIDPVGFAELGHPGMVNRYSYTYNDPMNLVDPTGKVVEFSSRTSVDHETSFREHVASSPIAQENFDLLHSSEQVFEIDIHEFNTETKFNPRRRKIQINPNIGTRNLRGEVISPASNSVSELRHGVQLLTLGLKGFIAFNNVPQETVAKTPVFDADGNTIGSIPVKMLSFVPPLEADATVIQNLHNTIIGEPVRVNYLHGRPVRTCGLTSTETAC